MQQKNGDSRKLVGETVEAYMNRRLFQPLGITIRWARYGPLLRPVRQRPPGQGPQGEPGVFAAADCRGGAEAHPVQGLGGDDPQGLQQIGDMYRILWNSVRVPLLRHFADLDGAWRRWR